MFATGAFLEILVDAALLEGAGIARTRRPTRRRLLGLTFDDVDSRSAAGLVTRTTIADVATGTTVTARRTTWTTGTTTVAAGRTTGAAVITTRTTGAAVITTRTTGAAVITTRTSGATVITTRTTRTAIVARTVGITTLLIAIATSHLVVFDLFDLFRGDHAGREQLRLQIKHAPTLANGDDDATANNDDPPRWT